MNEIFVGILFLVMMILFLLILLFCEINSLGSLLYVLYIPPPLLLSCPVLIFSPILIFHSWQDQFLRDPIYWTRIHIGEYVNSRKMREVCVELDINIRRHITTVKKFKPVFVNVHAHKIINNVSLLYDCQLLIISFTPHHGGPLCR